MSVSSMPSTLPREIASRTHGKILPPRDVRHASASYSASKRLEGMAMRSFVLARHSLLAGRRALTRQPLAVGSLMQRRLSTEAASEPADKPVEKAAPTEAATGVSSKMEFQAETKKLLDIVAKSLYTDKEVFVRELVSNSSDALEKRRHASLTSDGPVDDGSEMAIRISCDPEANTLTIQDSGVGMTKEDLVENLGTIARSGSKSFLQQLEAEGGK